MTTTGINFPNNIFSSKKHFNENQVPAKSNGGIFSSHEIEIFLSTLPQPYVVNWPKEARLKIQVVSSDKREPKELIKPLSNIYGRHCEEVGLDALYLYMGQIQSPSPEKIVFIQNYGPCPRCADLLNRYQECYTDTELSMVYVKEYTYSGLGNLSGRIHQCQLSSWRWIAFLLWNLGELVNEDQVVPWWQGEYAQCKDVINEGLKRCEIDIDASAKHHMKQLLLENGVGTMLGMINVSSYYSGKPYTLDELLSIINPVYPNDYGFKL